VSKEGKKKKQHQIDNGMSLVRILSLLKQWEACFPDL